MEPIETLRQMLSDVIENQTLKKLILSRPSSKSILRTEGHLFETFPNADGTKRYYIGVLSSDRPETLEIGGFTLPLHLCRLSDDG